MRQKTSEPKLTAEQIKSLEQEKKRSQSFSLTKHDIALMASLAVLFSLPANNPEEPNLGLSIIWNVITALLLSRAYNTSSILNHGFIDRSLHSLINVGGCYFALNVLKTLSDILKPDVIHCTPVTEPIENTPWVETGLENSTLSLQQPNMTAF